MATFETPRYDQYGLPTTTSGFELPGQAYGETETVTPVDDNALVMRIDKSFRLAGPKIGPDAWGAIQQLLTLESLAVMAGILTAWVAGHAFGISEIVDVILTLVGIFAIGVGVFAGIDELYEYAKLVYSPTGDLNRAADHLAQAIAILGFQAVLAFFFKFRPRGAVNQKHPFRVDPAPPKTPGRWYEPKTFLTDELGPGGGVTSEWGDVWISSEGTEADVELARLHERMHQILTPKFYLLRDVRVTWKLGAYIGSSLLRYLEETLAETRAQIKHYGWSWENAWTGIKFPVVEGYCYLFRAGSEREPGFIGFGILKELGTLIGIISDGQLSYNVVVATPDQIRRAKEKVAARKAATISDR